MANGTATKNKTEATDAPVFQIIDRRPTGRKAGGRDKSPLRNIIEQLEVNQFFSTGINVADLDKDAADKALANVRAKTYGVSSKGDAGKKFSVFVAEGDEVVPDGDIVVGRTA